MEPATHLGPNAPNGNLPSAFVASVALPAGIGREAYIAHCYATNTVTVITEYAEVFQGVPVSDNCMQALTFPVDYTALGSPVLCVTVPLHQQPVVTAVLKFADAKPTQFTERGWRRVLLGEETMFCLSASGDTGTFSVSAKTNETSSIRLLSEELKANLDVYLQGEFRLSTEELTTLLTQEGFVLKVALDDQQKVLQLLTESGLSYADNFKNKVEVTAEGFHYTYDGKAQRAELGEDSVAWKKKLIQWLQVMTVSTVFGPSGPPIDQVTLSRLLSQADDLLSDKTSFA